MDAPRDPIVEANLQLRNRLQWKPGKARPHLAKRIALGHLPHEASLEDYEALIRRVVQTPAAEVFVYRWGEIAYLTVVATVNGVRWLVMFSMDGVMETAFPPENSAMYLGKAPFTRVGTLEELGL
jgi:hypothetical protein